MAKLNISGLRAASIIVVLCDKSLLYQCPVPLRTVVASVCVCVILGCSALLQFIR